MEAASTPHNSRTLTIPIKYATNLSVLNIQLLKVGVRKSYFSPIKSLSGVSVSARDQKTAR